MLTRNVLRAKDLQGTILEILGTAFSVGCMVDGKSPKEISDSIKVRVSP